MAGLGSRLRAGWRAMVEALREDPHQADGSGTDSQPADSPTVDLRPRVRMPGPDAGSGGPPPEWLDYVMSQDPVWMSGGLGSPAPTFDSAPLADPFPTQDTSDDVSLLTSSDGHAGSDDDAPAERPVESSRSVRRPRGRLLRPVQPVTPLEHAAPVLPEHPAVSSTDSPAAAAAVPVRRGRRLLPSPEPAGAVLVAPGRPASRPLGDTGRDDRPPSWPTAVPAAEFDAAAVPPPAPTSAPAPVTIPVVVPAAVPARTRTLSTPAVLVPTGRVATLLPQPTADVAEHVARRAERPVPRPDQRPVLDPWSSTSSPGPVVVLRRELDDRPDPVDPPVAVRWRAVDVDRLGLEQRAL